MSDKLDRDFFDKVEAKLPKGYVLLREDIITQKGDLIYAGFGGGWSLDNIVDESWKQSPKYEYPKVSFFKAVARAVTK